MLGKMWLPCASSASRGLLKPVPGALPAHFRRRRHGQCSRAVTSRASQTGTPPTGASSEYSTSQSEGVPLLAHQQGTKPRICILGGGFGGLYTAVRLEALMWKQGTKPDITLIDQGSRFVFKPLLYELINGAASDNEVAPEYASLLAPYSARFIQSKVESVAMAARTEAGGSQTGGVVTLSDGVKVSYDWLVIALGAETKLDIAKGAKDHAIGFSTLKDTERVNAALECIERRMQSSTPVVTVVGAGYAGVELACTVAERLKGKARVQIISPSDTVMTGQVPALVAAARASMTRLGVVLRSGLLVLEVAESNPWEECSDLGKKMTLKQISGDGATTHEPCDLVLWTAGQMPVAAKVAGDSSSSKGNKEPFPISTRGQMQTDPTLRVIGHERVFAMGDSAGTLPSFEPENGSTEPVFPPTAQVALQQADYVAWNLWASINKRPLLSFRYQHLGTMMALGKLDGAVTLNVPVPSGIAGAVKDSPLGGLFSMAGINLSDTSGGLTVEGPLAGAMRRAAYLYRQPTSDQRLKVGASWLQSGASQLQSRVTKGQAKDE